ncbi:hypothetical protein [Flavobacterium sp. UBA7682]|uniref:hypothetical protein n=1 Tax=Flavobacterium sp. UBA7682 TaxID=1946560 RepID=UPI0025B8E9A5|nr:hypothetical protein [Flavobacterium sp. UBA7682]
MIYSQEFKEKVNYVNIEINKFIEITEKQNAKDQLLYAFREGLAELNKFIISDKVMDEKFILRWDLIFGQSFRSFEGHPFLDNLEEIHKRYIQFIQCKSSINLKY